MEEFKPCRVDQVSLRVRLSVGFRLVVKFFRNIRLLTCLSEVINKEVARVASSYRHGNVMYASILRGTLRAT